MKLAIMQVNNGVVTVHFLANGQTMPVDNRLDGENLLATLGYLYNGSVPAGPGVLAVVYCK